MKAWLAENWHEIPGYALIAVLLAGALGGIGAAVAYSITSGHWYLIPVALLLLAPATWAWLNRDEWL